MRYFRRSPLFNGAPASRQTYAHIAIVDAEQERQCKKAGLLARASLSAGRAISPPSLRAAPAGHAIAATPLLDNASTHAIFRASGTGHDAACNIDITHA